MAKKANDNMRIWDQVERTNPDSTTPISLGKRSFTAIDAQAQRKKATEVFGPFGKGHGVKDVYVEYLDVEDEHGPVKLASYMATFWYDDGVARGDDPPPSFPIASTIKVAYGSKWGRRVDDEYLKKVATDALTKGLSMLGFNADVFMGKFDDNRYVQAMRDEFATDNKAYVPKVKAPDALPAFESLLEIAAATGGTAKFRKVWAAATNDAEKACKEFIKNSAEKQTWLQDLKAKASIKDEEMEAQNAAQ